MTKKIIIASLIALSCLAIISPRPSLAAELAVKGTEEIGQNLGIFGRETGLGKEGDTDLKGRMAQIVNIILGMLGIVAVIYIIYGGWKWMQASGNEEEVTKAKETIRSAVIGLMVVFTSYIIINFVVDQLRKSTEPGTTTPAGGTVPPVDTKTAPAGSGGK